MSTLLVVLIAAMIAAMVLMRRYRIPSFAAGPVSKHPLSEPTAVLPWVVIVILVLGANWSAEQIIALVGALLGTGLLPSNGSAGSPAVGHG